MATQALLEWARQQGYLMNNNPTPSTSSVVEDIDEEELDPVARKMLTKVRELEAQLAKERDEWSRLQQVIAEQQANQARQVVSGWIKQFAQEDGVQIADADVSRIIDEASKHVAPGMSDDAVRVLMRGAYLEYRKKNYKTKETPQQRSVTPPPLSANEVRAKVSVGEGNASDYDARVQALIEKYLKGGGD